MATQVGKGAIIAGPLGAVVAAIDLGCCYVFKLDGQRRSPTEAVKAAKSYLGKTVPYHFTTTNCEYYSTEWLYGRGFTIQYNQAAAGPLGTGFAAQVHGGYLAILGTIIGGPIGGVIGYVFGSAAVGGAMSAIFDATGTTHYIRGENPQK